uniref:Uncharacterized protein n=1 Tax=Corethron hystrix TaxID=216773 RepID=A0A6U5F9K3_9STRA|mmetsp:Transcript_22302/g.51091  ORF Transcript_22302/g.51091 Transcript_22302/m.51091 type:complete len:1625 (+) Transcript_22302:1465-6339(+)
MKPEDEPYDDIVEGFKEKKTLSNVASQDYVLKSSDSIKKQESDGKQMHQVDDFTKEYSQTNIFDTFNEGTVGLWDKNKEKLSKYGIADGISKLDGNKYKEEKRSENILEICSESYDKIIHDCPSDEKYSIINKRKTVQDAIENRNSANLRGKKDFDLMKKKKEVAVSIYSSYLSHEKNIESSEDLNKVIVAKRSNTQLDFDNDKQQKRKGAVVGELCSKEACIQSVACCTSDKKNLQKQKIEKSISIDDDSKGKKNGNKKISKEMQPDRIPLPRLQTLLAYGKNRKKEISSQNVTCTKSINFPEKDRSFLQGLEHVAQVINSFSWVKNEENDITLDLADYNFEKKIVKEAEGHTSQLDVHHFSNSHDDKDDQKIKKAYNNAGVENRIQLVESVEIKCMTAQISMVSKTGLDSKREEKNEKDRNWDMCKKIKDDNTDLNHCSNFVKPERFRPRLATRVNILASPGNSFVEEGNMVKIDSIGMEDKQTWGEDEKKTTSDDSHSSTLYELKKATLMTPVIGNTLLSHDISFMNEKNKSINMKKFESAFSANYFSGSIGNAVECRILSRVRDSCTVKNIEENRNATYTIDPYSNLKEFKYGENFKQLNGTGGVLLKHSLSNSGIKVLNDARNINQIKVAPFITKSGECVSKKVKLHIKSKWNEKKKVENIFLVENITKSKDTEQKKSSYLTQEKLCTDCTSNGSKRSAKNENYTLRFEKEGSKNVYSNYDFGPQGLCQDKKYTLDEEYGSLSCIETKNESSTLSKVEYTPLSLYANNGNKECIAISEKAFTFISGCENHSFSVNARDEFGQQVTISSQGAEDLKENKSFTYINNPNSSQGNSKNKKNSDGQLSNEIIYKTFLQYDDNNCGIEVVQDLSFNEVEDLLETISVTVSTDSLNGKEIGAKSEIDQNGNSFEWHEVIESGPISSLKTLDVSFNGEISAGYRVKKEVKEDIFYHTLALFLGGDMQGEKNSTEVKSSGCIGKNLSMNLSPDKDKTLLSGNICPEAVKSCKRFNDNHNDWKKKNECLGEITKNSTACTSNDAYCRRKECDIMIEMKNIDEYNQYEYMEKNRKCDGLDFLRPRNSVPTTVSLGNVFIPAVKKTSKNICRNYDSSIQVLGEDKKHNQDQDDNFLNCIETQTDSLTLSKGENSPLSLYANNENEECITISEEAYKFIRGCGKGSFPNIVKDEDEKNIVVSAKGSYVIENLEENKRSTYIIDTESNLRGSKNKKNVENLKETISATVTTDFESGTDGTCGKKIWMTMKNDSENTDLDISNANKASGVKKIHQLLNCTGLKVPSDDGSEIHINQREVFQEIGLDSAQTIPSNEDREILNDSGKITCVKCSESNLTINNLQRSTVFSSPQNTDQVNKEISSLNCKDVDYNIIDTTFLSHDLSFISTLEKTKKNKEAREVTECNSVIHSANNSIHSSNCERREEARENNLIAPTMDIDASDNIFDVEFWKIDKYGENEKKTTKVSEKYLYDGLVGEEREGTSLDLKKHGFETETNVVENILNMNRNRIVESFKKAAVIISERQMSEQKESNEEHNCTHNSASFSYDEISNECRENTTPKLNLDIVKSSDSFEMEAGMMEKVLISSRREILDSFRKAKRDIRENLVKNNMEDEK